MAVNTSKNSDDYKKEIVKPISTTTTTTTTTNNTAEQPTTYEKITPDERDTKESKIQAKSESIKDKIFGKISEILPVTLKIEGKGKESSSNGIKSIMFGLFALIGFIIIVYSIFMGVGGEPLASIADTVFVAVIMGSFILVGLIIGRILLKK
jgi:hypothetical protein